MAVGRLEAKARLVGIYRLTEGVSAVASHASHRRWSSGNLDASAQLLYVTFYGPEQRGWHFSRKMERALW